MSGTVYIVHCVDTEGPLYETPTVPFEQIKNIFGFEIEPTRNNLIRLQKGELDLKGKEEDVKNLVDIHRITTRGSWEEIYEMLDTVTSEKYRNRMPDSNGNGWIFNWFCMDHAGFTGNNPRKRDAGYHKIFDRYMDLIKKQNAGDFIGFHYHPLPISGNYNDSGTSFWGGENLNQILTRKVIDRGWFPTAFRPGFHTERPDSNWFLEQWIPFDYGNQSTEINETGQSDLADGRFGDWRRASLEWFPYHPDHDDYQVKGTCRRWITRCLNMYARTRQITQEDVNKAFQKAAEGNSTILAFTDHDYKDMEFEIDRVMGMIALAHKDNPKVRYEYCNAIEAMRKALNLSYSDFCLEVDITKKEGRERLTVTVDHNIFGPQPFLSLKTKDGRYIWENFDVSVPKRQWTYTFDSNTIDLHDIDTIGVAANNSYGIAKVVLVRSAGKEILTYNA